MTDALRTMFQAQADGCEDLGLPLTARILRLLADAWQPGDPVADRVLDWPQSPVTLTSEVWPAATACPTPAICT